MAAGEGSYLMGPRQSQQEIHGLDWAGGAGAGFWDMFWYRMSAQILQDAVLFKATV